MIILVDSYADFVAVCNRFGVPQGVFYMLSSGNVAHATAFFLGGYGVFGSTASGAQSEASFLTEFPGAVQVTAALSLRSD